MFKKWFSALLALSLVLSLCTSALACTGIIAGKAATDDGSQIMGRSEDIGSAYHKNFVAVPAVHGTEPVTFTDLNGFTMELPGEAAAYTMTPDVEEHGDGIYGEACMNEYGVSMTATVSAAVNDAVMQHDPLVETGLREAAMATVVIPYVKTAKEAVQWLGAIVEKYGSAEGNIQIFADADEIWYMEILSGHQWAAVKAPEDAYAVIPNCYMLGDIDLSDAENVLASAQVLSLPEEKGFLKTHDGKPHLALTYGEELAEGNRARAWGGQHFFSPSAAVPYDAPVFDLFMQADKKISLLDAMHLLAYRYEGTEYDVNANPTVRAIGTERTAEAHLYHYKPGAPLTQWMTMGNPEHNVYLPAYCQITETPAAYQVQGAQYQADSAYWIFRGLGALAELDRINYGQGVKAYWLGYQQQLIAAQAENDAKIAAMDPAAAAAFANEQFAAVSADAIAKAQQMTNELMFVICKRANINADMKAPYTPSLLEAK